MKEIIIEIPEKSVARVREFVKKIGGNISEKSHSKNKSSKIISEMKDAVEEMKLIKSGNKKARNAEEFLNEL